MFAGEMRKSYALSLIQNFPELPKGRPFPRIAEPDIVTGLHDRVVDPAKLNQGSPACADRRRSSTASSTTSRNSMSST